MMTNVDRREPRRGVSWEQMEAVRIADLRSDYRDLTAGRRIEQGIGLSKLATTLAGKASADGPPG